MTRDNYKLEEDNKPTEVDNDEHESTTQPIDHTMGKKKKALVWGQLGTPINERDMTDTETGEAATLMESILIQSPEGHKAKDDKRPPDGVIVATSSLLCWMMIVSALKGIAQTLLGNLVDHLVVRAVNATGNKKDRDILCQRCQVIGKCRNLWNHASRPVKSNLKWLI